MSVISNWFVTAHARKGALDWALLDFTRLIMPECLERHVFVYGTLRRGEDNDINRLHPAPRYIGQATVAGSLYHLGPYPGVTLGGPHQVLGEVYAIMPALEHALDEIEAVGPQGSGEYRRSFVMVTVADKRLRCLIYEINPRHVQGRPRIASGDWVRGRSAGS